MTEPAFIDDQFEPRVGTNLTTESFTRRARRPHPYTGNTREVHHYPPIISVVQHFLLFRIELGKANLNFPTV